MTRPVSEIAAQLRRARNLMLRQAGQARAQASEQRERWLAEAWHCEREAAAVDAELSRMGLPPGPGTFTPSGGDAA